MRRRNFLMVSAGAALAAGAGFPVHAALARGADDDLRRKLAADRLRPQYHLMPAANWMNDPNGPIYWRGRYHMFFQYNPGASVWGDMHWAHATSEDMLHWRHEPVAIAPTAGGWDRDGVFSGCMVVDKNRPAAIYTGVLPPSACGPATLDDGVHQWREVQCLATAEDEELRRWKKLPDPVIAVPPKGLQVSGFRDPAVWREGERWMLALGSGFRDGGGAVLLYGSNNLRDWEYLHPLLTGEKKESKSVNPVDDGNMWECPDFFPLGNKHVLLISTAGKVWWKSGSYRAQKFHPEQEGVVDWGAYYAGRTMLDKQGRRVLWGWIPETRPEAEHRAAGWAGAMALPRILSLNTGGELEMQAAPEIANLRREPARAAKGMKADEGQRSLLRIENLSAEVWLECRKDENVALKLTSESGVTFFEMKYAADGGRRALVVGNHNIPLEISEPKVTLRMFVDGSVLEVFCNNKVAGVARSYRNFEGPLKVAVDGEFESLEVWQMEPISRDRLTT
jgi:beta-fructofuranosidase